MIHQLSKKLSIPALLLAICTLAHGLQIPWLGYYLDDWIILLAYNTGGAARLLQYTFLDNRPLVFWIWWLSFKLLGSAPLGWHIWALVWRWLAVVMAWLVLRALWPGHPRQALWASLLFAVYPLFLQQSIALTYTFHWVCFFLCFLSLYLMIQAARTPARYALFTSLAILTGALQLFTMEFFVGLELLRPVILFILLGGLNQRTSLIEKIKRTALQWGPYLLLFAGYLAWRLKWMPTPGRDRNNPEVFFQLFTSPLKALTNLGIMALKDMSEGLLGVWYRSLQASAFDLNPISNWLAWAVGLAAVVLLLIALGVRRPVEGPAQPDQHSAWRRSALILGLAAMLAGFAPGWLTGRTFSDPSGLFNDRYGLAAMFGAGILLVALLDLLVRAGRRQVLLICLLVGLGVSQQFRVTTQFRWSWEEQTRLFWQMKWRMPGLQPPTALFGSGALVKYIGSWVNTSAINLIYAPNQTSTQARYWYFDLYSSDIRAQLEDQRDLSDSRKFLTFQAPASQSLVFAYNVVDNQCLWVVDQADRHNPYLPPQVSAALPLSNLGLIGAENTAMRSDIFGKEPAPGWCYYFEKARLAEDAQNWQQMMVIWDAAAQNGFRPHSEPEYVPFILAAARTGRWDLALELSKKAYFPTYVMHDYLCTTWRTVRDEVPASPARSQALDKVANELDCQAILSP